MREIGRYLWTGRSSPELNNLWIVLLDVYWMNKHWILESLQYTNIGLERLQYTNIGLELLQYTNIGLELLQYTNIGLELFKNIGLELCQTLASRDGHFY